MFNPALRRSWPLFTAIALRIPRSPPFRCQDPAHCLRFTRGRAEATLNDGMLDIGANLLDPMYRGIYHGREEPYHPDDLEDVLERAWAAGVSRIMVTAGTLAEAQHAVAFCREWNERLGAGKLFTTVGVHPTRANEWKSDPTSYMAGLERVLQDDAAQQAPVVVAIGECGLDYDRLEFCDKHTQMECFEQHFRLAKKYKLPMFLHSRATDGDMVEVLKANAPAMVKGGVVHSFDGSAEEMEELLSIQCGEGAMLYIGINGCSMKTEDNLEVITRVPLARLMVETDAPWCGIRPSHASHAYLKSSLPQQKDKKKWEKGCMVKGRNEPGCLRQVVEVVSGVKGAAVEDVVSETTKNAEKMFF